MLDKTRKPLFPELGTKMKFRTFSFRKMSHSAEKCKKGDPLGYVNIHSVAKYQKTRSGVLSETMKNFRRKVAECRKKIKRGDPLVSSGFVAYVKNKKEGTHCTKFALAGLGLSSFASFCEKWTDQCEVCGLKKKGHCKSRAFFL